MNKQCNLCYDTGELVCTACIDVPHSHGCKRCKDKKVVSCPRCNQKALMKRICEDIRNDKGLISDSSVV